MTTGPKVRVELRCDDCCYELSEDHPESRGPGCAVLCLHPTQNRRVVGDSTWVTPEWCPLREDAIDRMVASYLGREGVEQASTEDAEWHRLEAVGLRAQLEGLRMAMEEVVEERRILSQAIYDITAKGESIMARQRAGVLTETEE